MSEQLLAVDIFCGAGGLSLGLRRAGFNVVAAIDSQPLAVETYSANHPDVHVEHADIREISPESLLSKAGVDSSELDLLAGCPPCQGFSRVRTLNGREEVEDPRNDLISTFTYYAKRLRPTAVMMENVPGLERSPRLEQLDDELQEIGYTTSSATVDAADFGVPQRRKRLVLLASEMGEISVASIAEDCDRRSVRDTISSLPQPEESNDPCHAVKAQRSERIMELIRAVPHDGGSRLDVPDDMQLECHQDFDGFKDVYGRMAWDEVAPTITGGCIKPSKGRFLHPTQNRAITPREAALLQSFPETYYFSMRRGKFKAAELIGNAFPPDFAEAQGRTVASHLRA